MRYSIKDLLSDALLIGVLLLIATGLYMVLKPSLSKIYASLTDPAKGAQPAVAIGATIPADWTVESLEGKKIRISDLKGKVVFLNIWATWCGPCLLELPSIEKLYGIFKDSGVEFLCVTQEDADKVRKFLEKDPDPIAVPLYVAEKLPDALNVRALPTTYILDREGRVAFSRAGAADWSHKKIIHFIQGLLQAPRAESDK